MSFRKYSAEELIEFKGNKKGLIVNVKKDNIFVHYIKKSVIIFTENP